MNDKKENKLIADPRYFYFFTFEANKEMSFKDFVKLMGVKIHKSEEQIVNDKVYYSRIVQVVSQRTHDDGDVGRLYNEKANLYLYDLLYAYMPFQKSHIICFPLKSMGQSCIDKMLSTKVLSKGRIVIPDVHKLSKIFGGDDIIGDNNSCHISSVRLGLPNTNLRSISLSGSRPLDTELYVDTFRKDVIADKVNVDMATCKMRVTDEGKTRRASVTTNKFGASKFYVHFDGVNLACLPYYIDVFYTYDCIDYTRLNPFRRSDKII